MASNLPEQWTEGTQKRKASDIEEDESSSLDSESASSSCSVRPPRKKKKPVSHSNYIHVSEEEDETDSSSYRGPLSGKKEGNFSASLWTYQDLLYVNIHYEKTPKPLEEFIKEVKDAFLKEKHFCPDPSKFTSTFKKQLESLTFSYELGKFKKMSHFKDDHKEKDAEEVKQELEENIQKISEVAEKIQSDNQFYGAMDSSMKIFAQNLQGQFAMSVSKFVDETAQLMLTMAYKGGRRGQEETPCLQTSENMFQHYCKVFGNMFFLSEGFIPQRTFSFKKRTVRSTPDLVYHFNTGKKALEEILIIIIEVKKSPVVQDATKIKELVGTKIMGQVGAELFGQSLQSVFYPYSLGILCMETKLVFVFLKISKDHSAGICEGDKGSPDDPGKIIYTQPFDILNADDRLKIADFLFWLGFVQDPRKYKFF